MMKHFHRPIHSANYFFSNKKSQHCNVDHHSELWTRNIFEGCSNEAKYEITSKTAYINGLVQERYNSSVLAIELCLPCTNPSICGLCVAKV